MRRLSRKKPWPAGALARRGPVSGGALTLLDTCSACGHSSSPFVFAQSDQSDIARPCLDVWRPTVVPGHDRRPLARYEIKRGERQGETAKGCPPAGGHPLRGFIGLFEQRIDLGLSGLQGRCGRHLADKGGLDGVAHVEVDGRLVSWVLDPRGPSTPIFQLSQERRVDAGVPGRPGPTTTAPSGRRPGAWRSRPRD